MLATTTTWALAPYVLAAHMLGMIGEVAASTLVPGMVVVESRRAPGGALVQVHLEVGEVRRDGRHTIYALPFTGEVRTVANTYMVDVI